MRITTLGKNGPEVGAIGLGCMGMSHAYDLGAGDDRQSIAVIHRALELSMTLLDTADVYGPFTNEELVGRAVADRRDRAFIATKVGQTWVGATPTSEVAGYRKDGRPEHIREAIDGSLKRLQTDHVDLYQLHRVDADVPIEETWGAMAEAVEQGKALRLGLSEVTVEQIERAHSVHAVSSVQSELSLWTREALQDVLPFCEDNGIAFLPFSPLGRGFLAGRFSSFDELPANDMRRHLPRFQQDALRENLAIVGRAREVADRLGATAAQVALAWVLAQGEYVIPIPGTKTLKYVADNAGAADVELTPEDLALLDQAPVAVGTRY